jgi:hypothetical protein
MEPFSLATVLDVIVVKIGPLGLVIYLWWHGNRRQDELIREYREDVGRILDQYKEDMAALRKMYESNVSLVEDYHSVAGDLKDVVILVTQQMTTVATEIRQNEFCPMVRVDKKKVIVGANS